MLGERRSRAGWCADLSEAFKNPDVEETEAATEREQKEEKGRLPENRPCTGKEPGRMEERQRPVFGLRRAPGCFFRASGSAGVSVKGVQRSCNGGGKR